MNHFGDHPDEMPRNAALDERSIEAILAGDAGATHPEMSAFVAEMRRVTTGPVPAPSAALSNLFLHGFSTEKGDLPATAASNVTGPAPQAAGLPKWRKYTMAVKQFVAGLSIAGKLAMGVGVAAAAATMGAGTAGVLPAPVQHEFAQAVDSFAPFDVKDPKPVSELGPPEARAETPAAAREAEPPSTTVAPPAPTAPPTTVAAADREPAHPPVAAKPGGDEPKPEAPVPTEPPHATTTVPEHAPTTTAPEHPTTTRPETKVPENLSIRCEQNAAAMSVNCFWTVLAPADTAKYLLLRIGPDGNRVVMEWSDATTSSFTDVHVAAGATYQYMVVARDAAGKNVGHSSYVPVSVVAR